MLKAFSKSRIAGRPGPAKESIIHFMYTTRAVLIDRDARLVAAWREAFRDVDGVEAVHGDFFSVHADAMVSPANSFGIMDGGLDLAIRETLGVHVEQRVRERIPEDASRSINAYLAFRAVLLALRAHVRGADTQVCSFVCPGLATGVGGMSPRRCAAQMRVAWRQATEPATIPSFREIHRVNAALRSD